MLQAQRSDLLVLRHACPAPPSFPHHLAGTSVPPSLKHFTGAPGLLQEVYVASERAKREAWMAEQTRSIKQATIKGLEPEIQVRESG